MPFFAFYFFLLTLIFSGYLLITASVSSASSLPSEKSERVEKPEITATSEEFVKSEQSEAAGQTEPAESGQTEPAESGQTAATQPQSAAYDTSAQTAPDAPDKLAVPSAPLVRNDQADRSTANTWENVANLDTEPPTGADDVDPPVFGKMLNRYAKVGSVIDYFSGITVTDNSSGKIKLKVDSKAVNTAKAGRYKIAYTAIDPSGNTAEAVNYITLSETDPDIVLAAADGVLEQILTEEMTQLQKAKAIFDWIHQNIGYVDTSSKVDAITACYDAFRKKSGDCFTYYGTAEILLTRAGIVNQRIDRYVTKENRRLHHYWNLVNLGTGWYHFDTTPFYDHKTEATFMFTESKARVLTKQRGGGCYDYDKSLYPEVVEDQPIE